MARSTDHQDDHDRGLAFDLGTLIARRRALGLGAALVVAGGAGWSLLRGGGEGLVTAAAADGSICVRDPVETAGPYPGDGSNERGGETVNSLTLEGIRRQDMRPSFAGLVGIAEGAELQLVVRLVDTSAACAPLVGHALYLWHCTASGQYSMYDLPEQNYLRAVGISDAQGEVRFTTIFPGCYAGRWPHMHFEVFADAATAVSGKAALLTSQIALPEAEAAALYAADARYAASKANLRATSLASDMVFRDNSPEQIAAQTMAVSGDAPAGYQGKVTVGL
jgi:protocatechuate 3,4-dioxygenase beta subunit